eukprot:jgi/Botrbrau1/7408/Bobra.0112s0008.1
MRRRQMRWWQWTTSCRCCTRWRASPAAPPLPLWRKLCWKGWPGRVAARQPPWWRLCARHPRPRDASWPPRSGRRRWPPWACNSWRGPAASWRQYRRSCRRSWRPWGRTARDRWPAWCARRATCPIPPSSLAAYCFCKKMPAVEAGGSSPPAAAVLDKVHSTVSHYNLIHVSCHAAARRADAAATRLQEGVGGRFPPQRQYSRQQPPPGEGPWGTGGSLRGGGPRLLGQFEPGSGERYLPQGSGAQSLRHWRHTRLRSGGRCGTPAVPICAGPLLL